MTDDLINRADTFDMLAAYYHIKTEAQLAKLAEAISRVPSAEPQRKKGGKIKMSDADGVYYCCSECGEEVRRTWLYCSNCGADVRGGHDDR